MEDYGDAMEAVMEDSGEVIDSIEEESGEVMEEIVEDSYCEDWEMAPGAVVNGSNNKLEPIVDFRSVKSKQFKKRPKVVHDFDLNEPSAEEILLASKCKVEKDFDLNKLPIRGVVKNKGGKGQQAGPRGSIIAPLPREKERKNGLIESANVSAIQHDFDLDSLVNSPTGSSVLGGNLCEQMFLGMKELFDLPEETKNKYTSPKPYRSYLGKCPYVPLQESFSVDDATKLDLARCFTNLMWPDQGNPSFL